MSRDDSQRHRIQGHRLERDLTLSGDVAVIGTGAGGGVTADILARAGLRVVMIEEGEYRQARDFTLEERHAFSRLYFEGGARKTEDLGITILQGRTVGGSTTVNWTSTFRTPAKTLTHWARVHDVKGLAPAEMDPWFARMEERLGVHPWPLPPNPNNAALARGAKKLGWRYGVIPRNVRNCLDLGYCGLGCPVNAKQSMLVTTIPAALDHGAVLATRVRAETLEVQGDRVTALRCVALEADGVRPSGRTVRVEAPFVVVAGGGINSPGLLLRSKVPDPHDLLGRRTFLHPVNASRAVMPGITDPFQGAPQSIYSDHFLWRGGVTGKAGYKLEVPPMQPVLALSAHYRFGPEMSWLADRFRHLQGIIALVRDGFHEESPGGRVKLRDDGSPRLAYEVSEYLWEAMGHSWLAMAHCQFAAGARRVLPVHMDASPYRSWKEASRAIPALPRRTPNAAVFSAHVMGGCAMGEDPRRAVVNSDGRHHQLENLAVIDGSVFPTSLGVNPQLSIYALAARNATLLAKTLGGTVREEGDLV